MSIQIRNPVKNRRKIEFYLGDSVELKKMTLKVISATKMMMKITVIMLTNKLIVNMNMLIVTLKVTTK